MKSLLNSSFARTSKQLELRDAIWRRFTRITLLASVWLYACLTARAEPRSFEIPAWAFDRGNAATYTNQWADAEPMVAFGGAAPIIVEYDIIFPASGTYTLEIKYAALDARPVELQMDNKTVAKVCRLATGGWETSKAACEKSAQLYIPAGPRTFRLQRTDAFPHIVSLRFTAEEIPANWAVNRPKARKLSDGPPPPVFAPYQPAVNTAALRRAIAHLQRVHGERYGKAALFLERLEEIESLPENDPGTRRAFARLQREALVESNPVCGFERLLLIKRGTRGPDLGLPYNWQSNSSLPTHGYDDSLCALEYKQEEAALETVFKPARDVFVGDVDLHWDANKALFSSVGTNGRWQVFEMELAGGRATQVRQLTGEQPDVDSYDACYLPDGRILFTCTACFIGVPCVYGSSHVANLYRMDADGRNIRQLCFDQEHDWCPTVLNDGRVLYTRWEYADTPHSNTRLLFRMNPDGTGQMEFLGSNSYWPNSFFYARPIPGDPSRVIAVIGGHHDNPRMGELVLFDAARGRREAEPAVQRIPGFGRKVEAVIKDGLALASWPKFLHPYPLNGSFFLVSCKPTPDSPWGIYLVDVFDNLVPLLQLPEYALFEPIPWRPTPVPPVIPDKVVPGSKDAVVIIEDIYAGDGLQGVPRGAVKALRVFTYHFAYEEMGGLLGVVGADGPWDIKRVLGTVPVNEDGSAKFLTPANTPISVQPLDAEGKAIQLMRSWMIAMPGETVQCVGCHETQNSAPPSRRASALNEPPARIKPWRGPARGFSYAREVQPVIDEHCVSCHNGQPRADGPHICDLRGSVMLTNWSSVTPGNGGVHAGKFSVGYDALVRYVRRPGIESDYHMLMPMEFHADTTDLVQMLKAGHEGVQLDEESWDRLVTWIDLNCPYHGTWGEIDKPGKQVQRRRDLLRLYGGVEDDPETIREAEFTDLKSAHKEPHPASAAASRPSQAARLSAPGWPFGAAEAQRRQSKAAPSPSRSIELGHGIKLDLVIIPAGEFVMGSASDGSQSVARLKEGFWMAARELDNRTYALFDPSHDSGLEDKNAYQFGVRGYPANEPDQPVVRVSWEEASAFCRWLSARTGQKFILPSEAQWEYACRAGTDTPFNYGDFDTDFSPYANLADRRLSDFASDPYQVDVPLMNPTPFDDWIPKDARFNDQALVAVRPGQYRPNAWGLCDMHGNVAEWTGSDYAAVEAAGSSQSATGASTRKVVRGGSWRDVPRRSTSSFRIGYRPWQRVYNVGFRVICVARAGDLATSK
jgi:formylglycine-generating enzyme required for sulfatase activity